MTLLAAAGSPVWKQPNRWILGNNEGGVGKRIRILHPEVQRRLCLPPSDRTAPLYPGIAEEGTNAERPASRFSNRKQGDLWP